MVRQYSIPRALALIFVVSLVATTAEGQVPTSADFAACNEEAPKAVKAGTASPTADDRVRADNLRADVKALALPYGGGKAIESSDPQIHGMSAEGATNAFYQAAYRSCMRRKGF
jgi:hypothetical protein